MMEFVFVWEAVESGVETIEKPACPPEPSDKRRCSLRPACADINGPSGPTLDALAPGVSLGGAMSSEAADDDVDGEADTKSEAGSDLGPLRLELARGPLG